MRLTEHMKDLVGDKRPEWETNKKMDIDAETLRRHLRYTQITQEDGERMHCKRY